MRLRIAARRAKPDEGDYRVQSLPRQKTFVENMLRQLWHGSAPAAREAGARPAIPHVRAVSELTKLQGVQARMPYEMRIE